MNPPRVLSVGQCMADHGSITRLMQEFGGIPAAVLQDPDLLRLVVPPTRADFEMIETYEYRVEPPLGCPISAFFSSQDRTQRIEDVRMWKEQTGSSFRFVEFPGGHFFLHGQRPRVLAEIAGTLGSSNDAASRLAGPS